MSHEAIAANCALLFLGCMVAFVANCECRGKLLKVWMVFAAVCIVPPFVRFWIFAVLG
jgi:hypothetical protein